jgi:YYY domain-containing protein
LIFIELPYQTGTASRDYLEFFSSKDRLAPMLEGYSDFADWDGGGNFWWHGARVLYDTNLDGSRNEIIDEFPQFSFILADNHPHVLALPYALLALGLALNTLLLWRSPTRIEIVLYSVFLGGLIFLNTWDGPIYMAAVVGADGLRRLIHRGNARLALRDFREMAVLALSLLALSAVFYLPFLVNFRSQAGGLLPNIANPTLFSQFFVMWGPFLLLLTPFLLVEVGRAGDRMNWKLGLQIALLVFALLAGAMLALAIIGSIVPSIRDTVLAYIEDNGGWGAVLPAVLSTRIANLLTTLALLALLALAAGRLFARHHQNEAAEPTHDPLEANRSGRDVVTYLPSTGFALLLICLGALLTLAPEYIYLRDVFGSRMNTVFKFYYQAWVLWSIAGAYGVYAVFSGVRLPSTAVRLAYAVFALVVIGLGLLNPILSIYQRTFIESGRIRGIEPTVTLDGASSFIRTGYISQDDYEALTCLGQTVQGDDAVVVEAYGNSYNWGKGRTGTLTGIPILFNWGGHQSQWRGSTYGETVGTRQQDIDLLYEDPTWNSAQQIIDRYGIDYVFFGSAERQQYGADAETKFADRLEVVCERGNSRYYRVSAVEVPVG